MIAEVIGFTKDNCLKPGKETLYTKNLAAGTIYRNSPYGYLDFPDAGYVIQFA